MHRHRLHTMHATCFDAQQNQLQPPCSRRDPHAKEPPVLFSDVIIIIVVVVLLI